MLPLNFNAPNEKNLYTPQSVTSFLPNPNVSGLLGGNINFSAPNTLMPNSTSTYIPQQWEGPSMTYKFGSLLSSSNHPLFRLIGLDMMSSNPKTQWTFTPN